MLMRRAGVLPPFLEQTENPAPPGSTQLPASQIGWLLTASGTLDGSITPKTDHQSCTGLASVTPHVVGDRLYHVPTFPSPTTREIAKVCIQM